MAQGQAKIVRCTQAEVHYEASESSTTNSSHAIPAPAALLPSIGWGYCPGQFELLGVDTQGERAPHTLTTIPTPAWPARYAR